MVRRAILIALLVPFVGCADNAPTSQKATESPHPGSARKPAEPATAASKEPQEKAVVSFTDAAAAKVREFQQNADKPYLRVAVQGDETSGFMYDLQLDDQVDADGDFVDEIHGLRIVVDRESAVYLEGTLIDWETTDDGREGFVFDNPNAERVEY